MNTSRVVQAYAAIMVARNMRGTTKTFDPKTFNQSFQKEQGEELRRRIYGSSIAPAQLIIAENDRRAEQNTGFLMHAALCPHEGYGDHAFSLSNISDDIRRYFDVLNSSEQRTTRHLYLIGGWVFVKPFDLPFIQEKLVAGSSIGASPNEAMHGFIETLPKRYPNIRGTFYLGHAFRYREVTIHELTEQYVFQSSSCPIYH